jgi:5'-nucleotidase (lipoprotein e(P4) family)
MNIKQYKTKNCLVRNFQNPIIFLILISMVSCTSPEKSNVNNYSNDKLLMAVSCYQHSSEVAALYHQGFNIAKFRLDHAIKAKSMGKPFAVVVDIDETMIDNSPFETTLFSKAYKLSDWYAWTSIASAKALPGALDFAKYAQSQHVEIFYITNRDDSERVGTLKNLENVGFPFADEKHLLTKSDLFESTGNTSSKEGRRRKVAENYEIALLIGDNLNDFSQIFEDRNQNNGKDAVEKNKEQFGKKFIVMPNPMYGAWEKPLYNYKEGLDENEKTRMLRAKLKPE